MKEAEKEDLKNNNDTETLSIKHERDTEDESDDQPTKKQKSKK